MVGAAGFPCGQFPDGNCLRAGPRGFALRVGKLLFARKQKHRSVLLIPAQAKQFACSRPAEHIKQKTA